VKTIYDDLLAVHATKGDVLQMSSHIGALLQCLIQSLVKKGLITIEEIDAEMATAEEVVAASVPLMKAQAETKWRAENPDMAAAWDELRNAAEAQASRMGA
jgi:hypothetical protein